MSLSHQPSSPIASLGNIALSLHHEEDSECSTPQLDSTNASPEPQPEPESPVSSTNWSGFSTASTLPALMNKLGLSDPMSGSVVYGLKEHTNDIKTEPCRYTDDNDNRIPYDIFYGTILHSFLDVDVDQPCRNTGVFNALFPHKEHWECVEEFKRFIHHVEKTSTHIPENQSKMGIVHRLFYCARASFLQHCNCRSNQFLPRMPRCPSWPGLDRWAAQLIACWRYPSPAPKADSQHELYYFDTMIAMLEEVVVGASFVDPQGNLDTGGAQGRFGTVDQEYINWAGKINIIEILSLVSWLKGIANRYQYLVPGHGFDYSRAEEAVNQAAERAKGLGLCMHRVWSRVDNAPGGHLNLPVLIPCIPEPPSGWRHDGHLSCTKEYCWQSNIDTASVEQLHVCTNPLTCVKTEGLFPQDELLNALLENFDDEADETGAYRPTPWALDGLSILLEDEPFMAISHVWSDGTGNAKFPRGIVNKCLYDFFCDRARELGCAGIWWDAICLPLEKKARIQAINNMHLNYSLASVTLVHDRYLSTFEYSDPAEACFAILMSSWFTRGWTALELARSYNIKVLFTKSGQPLVLDLDDDILSGCRVPTHSYHLLATSQIRQVKAFVSNINSLLTVLGPRHTAVASDKVNIAGLLGMVDNPASMTPEETYQELILGLVGLDAGNLFHGAITMTGSFNWCPIDIFKMPMAESTNSVIVMQDGSLSGDWNAHCLSRCANQLTIQNGTHPLVYERVQKAIKDARKHVLLTEYNTWGRGLLVKVKRGAKKGTWRGYYNLWMPSCELIGPVTFQGGSDPLPLKAFGWIKDLAIGDVSNIPELPEHISACAVIGREEPHSGAELDTSGVADCTKGTKRDGSNESWWDMAYCSC